jgi:hypothetical protein
LADIGEIKPDVVKWYAMGWWLRQCIAEQAVGQANKLSSELAPRRVH